MGCTPAKWAAVCIGLTACATTAGPSPRSTLDVARGRSDLQQNPKLLQRIRGSPHGYFRFINTPFSEEVCQQVKKALERAPRVNLHGDAHLEQYAVTDLGRGLTDFDDATTGPAPIDLVRFGVSITLATWARGWQAHTDPLLSRFVAGYRQALEAPDTKAPFPAAAKRIQARFSSDRSSYLDWVKSVSHPVAKRDQDALAEALVPYVETMRRESPQLDAGFFSVVETRRLTLGIGSALDDKYVVRVQGPTPEPQDDVILEVKEVRDLSGVSCVSSHAGQDPFRILVAQSRIAYRPYRFLGYIRIDGRPFWIHAWVDNYRELKLGESVQSPEELAEIVYDVGVQLGRGHPSQIAAPLDTQLRQALLTLVDTHEDDFHVAVRRLSQEVYQAWQRFVGPVSAHERSAAHGR